MIIWTSGNLLDRPDRVPVIPVNCEGVAGAGLAKAWAERNPILASDYRELCRAGKMRPGNLVLLARANGAAVLFPTKDHWRNPSHIAMIQHGLMQLPMIAEGTFAHFAVPRLGCGLGGLDWRDVRPLVDAALGDGVPGVYYVYEVGP